MRSSAEPAKSIWTLPSEMYAYMNVTNGAMNSALIRTNFSRYFRRPKSARASANASSNFAVRIGGRRRAQQGRCVRLEHLGRLSRLYEGPDRFSSTLPVYSLGPGTVTWADDMRLTPREQE
ncbi:MAG TPA: hypothetical protein VGL99_13005, partial [Chloroflexota bacterium]